MDVKEVDIGKLVPYVNNPRRNDEAVDAVASSIKEFGWQQPIVVDKDNVIVIGHTRYKAAQKLGYTKVPVIYADSLSPAQVKALRIADNKVSQISNWDYGKLEIELEELKEEDFDVSLTGFDDEEVNNILANSYDESGEEAGIDGMDDLFADAPQKEKEAKKIQCPNCGEWIEL